MYRIHTKYGPAIRVHVPIGGTMMKSKKRNLSRRVWLCPNDPDTFSYVAYSRCSYDERNTMNLKIADCNRGITLFLDGKAGMRKLDKLIRILEDARDEHQLGIDEG